jgi:branched-chain amino acid transport system substrate-binding protein
MINPFKQILFAVSCIPLIILINFSPLPAAESVKVASIYAHTGVAAQSNIYSIKGVREAINEINSRGGVLGRKFELIELDNMSTPIGSKVAAEKAVKLQVTAVIGADWSSHTLAIAPIAQANKIPMITNTSTNDEITKIGNYIFRVCYTDSFQGRVMAKFAREDLHAGSAVMFVDLTSDYALGLSKIFRENFEGLGGKVSGRLDYTLKQENFRSLAAKAKRLNPDVVFIPGYEESAAIIKELIRAGCTAIPLGGDGWGSERFFKKGGKDISTGYYAGHWSENNGTDTTRAFLKKYKHGQSPVLDAEALAYDAVNLLADAIHRADSHDKAKIRDALAATKGFRGVTGTISFHAQGDPIKGVVIIKIKDGTPTYYKTIFP